MQMSIVLLTAVLSLIFIAAAASCVSAASDSSVAIYSFNDDKCVQRAFPNAWLNAPVGTCTTYAAFSRGLVPGSCAAWSAKVKLQVFHEWSCHGGSSTLDLPLGQCIRSPFSELKGFIVAYCSTAPRMCENTECGGGADNLCCFGSIGSPVCCNFLNATCGYDNTQEGSRAYCKKR